MVPTTKMHQLNAKNPGLLALLDEHLDKRKRPSWIAGKIAARFLVAVTIEDIVDYIGHKAGARRAAAAAPPLPLIPLPLGEERGVAEAGVANRESGVGQRTPRLESDSSVCGPDATVSSICGAGTEQSVFSPTLDSRLPTLLSSPTPDSRLSIPVSGCAVSTESSVVSPTPDSLLPAPAVLMIPRAKPPKRAVITPRKRKSVLRELQVALLERLMEGKTERGMSESRSRSRAEPALECGSAGLQAGTVIPGENAGLKAAATTNRGIATAGPAGLEGPGEKHKVPA